MIQELILKPSHEFESSKHDVGNRVYQMMVLNEILTNLNKFSFKDKIK